MSAVAGLYRTDGQAVDRHDVESMVAALAHRGPDGAGVWTGGPAGLGQAALWTTPESRCERIPLANGTGDIVITANARLDNRSELIAALPLAGRPDIGDSELILRAYERWGEGCVPKLIGDFVFAIWDSRSQTLFCARDHVGVKPFYYHQAPGAFLFASEIKALLTSPMVPYRLNPRFVADHLVGLFDDRASTFYQDIYRLPAGHTLTASRAGTRVRSYWSLDPTREIRLGSDEAYADMFRECFAEAVRCRLRSPHPVGCLLSGGLDTSSIVGVARQIRGLTPDRNLDTFTAIFPGLPAEDLRKIDERAFVEAVVAQGGLSSHYVRGDLLSPLTDVERVLWHLDEAHPAPNLYLHWALYGAAQASGVRVLLDGIDGDSTVSHGLEYLADLTRAGRVWTLANELRAFSGRYRIGCTRLLWQYGVQPLLPASVRGARRLFRRRGEASWLTGTMINLEFARSVGVVDRLEAAQRGQRHRSAREAHQRGMNSGLIPYALEMADKTAAAFDVEPRYPFFDRRLMELCLSLPPDQKLQDGWTRMVMRRAMGGILPEDVRWRAHKANLGPNFKRRLLEQDRDLLREVIIDHPDVIEDYVDVAALRRAYQEGDAIRVYRAVVLALWLREAKISL